MIHKHVAIRVALVRHCVLDRILDVWEVLANRLIVTLLWQVSDSEWTVLWWINFIFWLEWEGAIAAISFSMRIEATVLEYTCCVWLTLIKNQCSSSLVIKFSHIFLALVCIFCVNESLLKRLVSRPGHKILRRILRAGMVIWELFHVQELGILN